MKTLVIVAVIAAIFGSIIYWIVSRNNAVEETSSNQGPKRKNKKFLLLVLIPLVLIIVSLRLFKTSNHESETKDDAMHLGKTASRIHQLLDPLKEYVRSGAFDDAERENVVSMVNECDSILNAIGRLVLKIENDSDISLREAIEYNRQLYELTSSLEGNYARLNSNNKLTAVLDDFRNDFKNMQESNTNLAVNIESLRAKQTQDSVKYAVSLKNLNREIVTKNKSIDSLQAIVNSAGGATPLEEQLLELKDQVETLKERNDLLTAEYEALLDSTSEFGTLQQKYDELLEFNSALSVTNENLRKSIPQRIVASEFSVGGYTIKRRDKIPISNIRDGFIVSFKSTFIDKTLQPEENILIKVEYPDNSGIRQTEYRKLDVHSDNTNMNQLNVKLNNKQLGSGIYTVTLMLAKDSSYINDLSIPVGLRSN